MKVHCIASWTLLSALVTHSAIGQVADGTDTQSQAELQLRDEQRQTLKSAISKSKIDSLLEESKLATDLLSQVSDASNKLLPRLDKLMTNDDGKRIALDKSTFLLIDDLQTNPIVTSDIIAEKTNTISGIRDALTATSQADNVGTIPPTSIVEQIDDIKQWAKEKLIRIKTTDGELDAAILKVPADKDLRTAPTLKARIDSYNLDKVEALNKAFLDGTELAKSDAEQKMVETGKITALLQAQEASDRELKETKSELERLRVENEMRIAQLKDEEAARDSALQKQLASAEAARTVAAAQNQVTIQKATQDAELAKKRQQCHDPAVIAMLQPFTYKGYFQPKSGRGIEAKPMSLAEIRTVGALTPSPHGLDQLIKCANWSARGAISNDDRPSWGRYLNVQQASNDEVEMVKKVQATLIELGDALVDEGMLSP